MKKLLKVALALFILLVVVLAAAAIIVTRPGVQKSLLLSALEDQGDHAEVALVQAGPSEVHIQGLKFERPDLTVELADFTLEYSLWSALFGNEIRVDTLAVQGLKVDVAASLQPEAKPVEKKPSSTESGFPEFNGVFENAELPARLVLGTVDVAGQVNLPQRVISFNLSGGNIAPGQTGELVLKASIQDQTTGAAASNIECDGKARFDQSNEQRLRRVELTGTLQASGGSLTRPATLSLQADARDEGDVESYAAKLQADGSPLLTLDARFERPSQALNGELKIDATRQLLAPFLMGANLPEFSLKSDETFQLDGKKQTLDADASLRLELSQLGEWKATLASIGSGTLEATLKARATADHIALETLQARFDAADGRQLLQATLLQAFSARLENGQPALDSPSGDLLALQLANFPLAWLAPFVPGVDLSGDDLSAGAKLSATGPDQYQVTATTPWQANRLTVSQDGEPLLNEVDLALTPTIQLRGPSIEATLDALSLRSQGKALAEGSAHTTFDQTQPDRAVVKLDLQGDLAALQAQPVLEPWRGLAGGQYRLGAQVSPADSNSQQIQLLLALANLTSQQSYDQLPKAQLNLNGTATLPDRFDLQGQLSINGTKQASDAQLTAKVDRSGGINRFNVSLTGQTLVTDDVQFLAAAFQNPNAPAESAPADVPATTLATASPAIDGPDAAPAWQGNEGQAVVQFAQVLQGDNQITGLDAQLTLTSERLQAQPLRATLNGAPAEAHASIDFRAGKTRPYLLDAALDLQKLEVGPLLAQGGKPPSITGPFTVQGKAQGESTTLAQAADTLMFDLDVKGGPGRVRGLQQGTAGGSVAGVLGLAGGIASLVGGKTVSENAAFQSLNGIIQSISKEIDYQLISVEATRGENLNIVLKEFQLDSPKNDIKFTGQGQITYQAGAPIPQQPMAISARLWTKGQRASVLRSAGLTRDQKDADGYSAGPGFEISGTLASPDYISSLATTLLSNTGDIVGGLVGGNGESAGQEAGDAAKDAENEGEQAAQAVGGLLQGLFNRTNESENEQ